MKEPIRVGLAVAILSLAGAAWAQEDSGTAFDSDDEFGGSEQQQQTQEQPQQPASEQGTGGTRGVESPGGQQGEAANVTTEEYRDWTVRCGQPQNGGGERCEMSQKVTRGSGEAVMRVAVGFTQQGQPAAIFQLPLGIVLPKGVALRVDDGEPARFPVQICVQQGCRADLPLKDELLQQMKAGRRAYVTVRTPRAEDGKAELAVSLLGFTAAFNRISEAR